MKYALFTLFAISICTTAWSQDFDTAAFKADIAALYESANHDFDKHLEGEPTDQGDHKQYATSLVLHGADEAYITEDDETSRAYIAHFTMKNVRNPQEKVDEIVQLIAEVCEQYGLEVNSASSIKYLGYTMKTLEYPSDNIDEMGRYPNFAIGMLEDGNPMEFEIIINEPFWK